MPATAAIAVDTHGQEHNGRCTKTRTKLGDTRGQGGEQLGHHTPSSTLDTMPLVTIECHAQGIIQGTGRPHNIELVESTKTMGLKDVASGIAHRALAQPKKLGHGFWARLRPRFVLGAGA
jgi:hypothetical protein